MDKDKPFTLITRNCMRGMRGRTRKTASLNSSPGGVKQIGPALGQRYHRHHQYYSVGERPCRRNAQQPLASCHLGRNIFCTAPEFIDIYEKLQTMKSGHKPTDLIEPSLGREDRNVTIESSAAADRHLLFDRRSHSNLTATAIEFQHLPV